MGDILFIRQMPGFNSSVLWSHCDRAHVLHWEVLLGSCYLWDLLMTSKCKTTVMHYETILMSFNSRVESRCLTETTELYVVFLCCVWSAHLALKAKWVWPTYFKLTVSSTLCCAIITHSAQSKPLPSGIWALLFAVSFKSGCVPVSASLHRDTAGKVHNDKTYLTGLLEKERDFLTYLIYTPQTGKPRLILSLSTSEYLVVITSLLHIVGQTVLFPHCSFVCMYVLYDCVHVFNG